MRVIIGSDHAGIQLKKVLAAHLSAAGHEIEDLGTHDTTSTDYPDHGLAVAQAVAASGDPGILVCGTGQGMAMAASKV